MHCLNSQVLTVPVCRLLVHSLGGEGYLNFEGNEFGHPEVRTTTGHTCRSLTSMFSGLISPVRVMATHSTMHAGSGML